MGEFGSPSQIDQLVSWRTAPPPEKRTTPPQRLSDIILTRFLGISIGSWLCILGGLLFPGPFYALCAYVESDPDAVIVDGHPMPQLVTNVTTVAFLTCMLLDGFAWAWTVEKEKSQMFAFPLTIQMCSFCSYVALAMGWAPVLSSFNGKRFIPSRYLKWVITTPLMLITYAVLCEITVVECLVCVVSDLLMLLFGALASYCKPPHNYVYLGLSFMFYFPVIYYIDKMLQMAIDSFSAEQREIRRAFNSARLVMLMGWVSMPAIWILGWLGWIDPTQEEIGYQVVDFLTKCGCSSMLMHSSLRTQADREAERSREALSEERGRMVDLLQSTTLQRRKFVAALSAQLRSPLVSMADLVEELLDAGGAGQSTEEQVSQLNAFVTAGTHLVFTIDDMLALSQKKQKQRGTLLPVSMWDVDIAEMMQAIVQLTIGINKHALDFQVHSEPDLPKARVDVRRAHQALHNVLSYVAHCAAEHGVANKVEIDIKPGRDRQSVLVEMVAHGAPLGFSNEVCDVIRSRFGPSDVDPATTVPETLANVGLWNVGPEDAARDESLQCLLIAKDLLFETGGSCSLLSGEDGGCALVAVLPCARGRAFGFPSASFR